MLFILICYDIVLVAVNVTFRATLLIVSLKFNCSAMCVRWLEDSKPYSRNGCWLRYTVYNSDIRFRGNYYAIATFKIDIV